MSVSARANEPSMEEILASIRRIISDDVAGENAAAHTPAVIDLAEAAPVALAAAPEDEAERAPETEDAALPSDGAPPGEAEPAAAAEPARAELSVVEPAAPVELDAVSGGLHAQALHERVMAAVTRSVESLAPKVFSETADMQVQAKPAVVTSRVAAASRNDETETMRNFENRPLLARAQGEAEARSGRLVSGAAGESVSASFGALARAAASNTRSMEDVVTDALRPMLKSWLDENLPDLVERLVRAEIERVARHGQ